MIAPPALKLRVTFAWWLQPYLKTLVFFAVLMRREPDWGKVGLVIKRAIRVKVA